MPDSPNGSGSISRSVFRPTASFPGAVAGDAQLAVAVDREQTTLAQPLAAADTSMTVANIGNISTWSLLSIENEIVQVNNVPAGNVAPISRGFDGTTPAVHLAGATVAGLVTAYHHNALVSEVEAIEQTLGANLANLGAQSTFNAGTYNFPAQFPGGSLTPGLNVINLAPVPRGVNGSNTKHYLYISGGTGAPEAVLITGGTAVAGAASGTVIVSCANAHSGAWSISSATLGIQEAEKSLPASGGVIVLPSGSLQMQAPVSYQQHRVFRGLGPGTRLIPASSSAIVFDWNLPQHSTSPYNFVVDNIWFEDFVIDGAAYPANTVIGVRNWAQGNELGSVVGMRFDRVTFNNIRYAVSIQRANGITFQGVRAYGNTQFFFGGPTNDATVNHNYKVVFDDFQYLAYLMDGSPSDPITLFGEAVIHVEAGELTYISNAIFDHSGGSTGMHSIGFFSGGEDLSISNVVTMNANYAVYLAPLSMAGTSYYPGYVKISNLSCDSIWGAAVWAADGVDAATGNVHNISITSSLFTNPHPSTTNAVDMVHLGQYARYVAIADTHFVNLGTNSLPQTGIAVLANTSCVLLDRNLIVNSNGSVAGSGIYMDATAGVWGLETTTFWDINAPMNDGGQGLATVASAATITLPQGRSTVYISGSVNISTINTYTYDVYPRSVTLIFLTGGLTVLKGANLHLNSNLVTTQYTTLTIKWLGTFWAEVSRSVN